MKPLEENFYEYTVARGPSRFVELATKRSGCFRTEVRSTGDFICGIHQAESWTPSWAACPDILAMADLVESALYEVGDDYFYQREQRNS